MEDLSKYLPLYLGQKVVVFYENPEFAGNGDIVTLTPDLLKELLVDYPEAKVKIHCRPLSSITEKEKLELYKLIHPRSIEDEDYMRSITIDELLDNKIQLLKLTEIAEGIQWLLSKGFDIFGLKEKGLALYPEDL